MPSATTLGKKPPKPQDDLDNYNVDDDSDDPFKTPPPESSTKKRKEPTDSLGLDEEIDLKKKTRVPTVKLDEDRLLSKAGIPELRRRAKQLKLKGKGHEFTDAARMLSFYQLWLDDLFPKARFLDALAMVEKAGHKKKLAVARGGWIEEGRPKLSSRADEGDEELDLVADPTATTTTQGKGVEGRPRTPTHIVNGDDNEEDLYDATPRRNQTKKAADASGDVPGDDDLDALMAEAEAQDHESRRLGAAIPVDQGGPDEDEMDALMAESEQWDKPSGGKQAKATATVSVAEPGQGQDPGDEDMDALIREAEKIDSSKDQGKGKGEEEDQDDDDFAAEEAVMQEMDGLW